MNELELAKSIVSEINVIKNHCNSFTRDAFNNYLKESKVQYFRHWFPILKKKKIIVPYNDKYKWASTEPVHYTSILDSISKVRSIYSKKKKVNIDKNNDDLEIEKAIQLLKSKGYRIYRQEVKYTLI